MARSTKPTPAKVSRENARHLEAFEAWYSAQRNWSVLEKIGVKKSTGFDWADKFNWHERADERDGKAQKIADSAAIQARAKRIIEQRKAGELLRMQGVKHFSVKDYKFTTERGAIAAIQAGVAIERQADGMPDYVLEILNLNDDELEQRRAELDARRRAATLVDRSEISGQEPE